MSINNLDSSNEQEIPKNKNNLNPKIAYLLCFISGILYWLAFPPIDIWFLTFICWVPMLIAIRNQPPKEAFFMGLTTGFTLNVFGFHWLYITIRYFGNFHPVLSVFFMLILCLFQALRTASFSWLFARSEKNGWNTSLGFILAFIASEVAFPVLFPWYTSNHLHSIPLLIQTADIGGPVLVGCFSALFNLSVVELIWAKRENRNASKAILALGVIAPLIMVSYGLIRTGEIEKIMADAAKGKIGVVQGNRSMLDNNTKERLTIHREESARLEKEDKLDFILWSEGAIPFSFRDNDIKPFFRDFIFKANNNFGNFNINTPIITGGFVQREEEQKKRDYNIALLSQPDGTIGGIYKKVFLIPLGEYIPLGETFPVLYQLSPNSLRLSSGTDLSPLTFKNYTITPLICYEDIKPAFANSSISKNNPDLLVSFANDGWFGESTVPIIHFSEAKFRAVEHRRYMVRAANTGISGFIDPLGRSYQTTEAVKKDGKVGEIGYMKMKTIYEILGDIPFWIGSVLSLIMSFFSLAVLKKKLGLS